MADSQPPYTPLSKEDKIYVAGHRGMVGSAVWRALEAAGYTNLIGRTSQELDLRNQRATLDFFQRERPTAVVDAAAKVGGILANQQDQLGFLMDNLLIQNNLIFAALATETPKFLFLGSSCIYPKLAPQPLKEEYLLTGPLEPTNEGYALAKITGLKLCEAARNQRGKEYLSLMPTNLYGPGDNFDLETSHVLPALIRKFHEAKENNHAPVTLWGTGSPMREFLHVDDLARAVVFALERPMAYPIYNVGTGKDIAIKDLALLIREIVGHTGEIIWDRTKPDGTPRKVLDVSRMKEAGWEAEISLKKGIENTFTWFQEHFKTAKL
jgi:GDP-L-fucose synthase